MPTVQIASGALAGRGVAGGPDDRTVWHFGGVPYASATRFGVPGPPEQWTGLRDATRPGAAPPQRSEGLDLVPGMTPAETREACLTAEVWTPDATGSRAVLVWIPGGSFRIGGAGLPTYDGRHLAAEGDVVVVGLNYRLGAFGFLAAEGVPANLGLRDLLAALDWIQDQVSAFGGDPRRVTLIGESAGAGAILHLLTRPNLACSGAIVLSGSATLTLDTAVARRVAERVLELAAVDSARDLLDRSVDALLDVQMTAVADLAASVGMMPFHPWVDGDVVPRAPLEAAARGELAAVPLVIGTNAHEMELFRSLVPALPAEYAGRFLQGKADPLALTAEAVERGFAACGGDLVSAIADIDLQLPALRIARSHAGRGLPVWRTTFTWESPGHLACHALDLPFHFGTLDVAEWRSFAGAEEGGAADRLSRRMRAAWAAFATAGRPACEPIGEWPGYDGGWGVIELGPEVRVGEDPAAKRLGSWEGAG